MSTPEQMPFTRSVPNHVSQLPERLLAGLCALTWLNGNSGWSAVTGAALREPPAGAMPAGVSACATGVDAVMRNALSLQVQVQAHVESVAGPRVKEMTRAILARAAKAASDTAKRRSPPFTQRWSDR